MLFFAKEPSQENGDSGSGTSWIRRGDRDAIGKSYIAGMRQSLLCAVCCQNERAKSCHSTFRASNSRDAGSLNSGSDISDMGMADDRQKA